MKKIKVVIDKTKVTLEKCPYCGQELEIKTIYKEKPIYVKAEGTNL